MRVLHIISDGNIGGAGILLLNLLRHFDPSRVESVVALPRGSALCERVAATGTPYLELESPCDRPRLSSVRELRRMIRAVDPAIVHTNAAVSARIAGRFCRRAVVYTRHCCFPPSGFWRDPLLRAAGGLCNRMFYDRVIATAESAAENLTACGVPRRHISVIVNGTDGVRPVSEEEKRRWRERLGIRPEDFCVGICARLEPCKGHDTFLRAARLVRRILPGVRFRFLLMGTGSLMGSLRRRSDELGLSDAVIFTGFLPDPAPVYRLLRIHVNCSCGTETSCLAVSEGMSAGLPTVLTDFGGNPAMLGSSGAGFCVPVGNAFALAEAICRIASRPALESAMSARARKRYEESFTAARMTDQLTAVYEQLAER